MTARYEWLAIWANEKNWTMGAELGVLDGRTHIYLLENCRQLTLVGVDVWDLPGFKEGPTKSGERCFCDYCNETRSRRQQYPHPELAVRSAAAQFGDRSKLLKMPTVEAAKGFPRGTFDFVFVDADHSYEGARADIAAWKSRIKPGGAMIGHDWNMSSIRRAVLDHFHPNEIMREAEDHLWAVVCP